MTPGKVRANAFESQYTRKRSTTAYISFQPTETCTLAPVRPSRARII